MHRLLPAVDRATLAEHLGTLRSELIEYKLALMKIVEHRKLDSNDVIITAIMPGGLLYAGFSKVHLEQTKNELERVRTDIETISDDLLAMQPGSTPAVVAQLR